MTRHPPSRRFSRFVAWLPGLSLVSCAGPDGTPSPPHTPAARTLILATTTSTYDTGLLDSLVPLLRTGSGIEVKVIAVGSGAALDMARRGDADAVLVHAPEQERELVASGDLTHGRLVMHNDFVIVGPRDDPAGVGRSAGLAGVMTSIARRGRFVSRGDGSGTESREMAAWRVAGIDPASLPEREETGQGMGATLRVTDQRRSYTLSDRGTYLALRPSLALDILYEGDPELLNVYHAYVVNPVKHPRVKSAEAALFVEFLVAPTTQRMIGNFGRARYGEPLFVPDAGKDTATLTTGRVQR